MNRTARRYLRTGAQQGVTRGDPVGFAVAELNGETIQFGFSLCSDKDTFNYDRARQIAEGRLQSNEYAIPSHDATNLNAIRQAIMARRADEHTVDSFDELLPIIAWVAQRCSQ